MHLMTKSQLDHLALNCNKIDFVVTQLDHESFPSYMDVFLKPFQISLASRKLELDIS